MGKIRFFALVALFGWIYFFGDSLLFFFLESLPKIRRITYNPYTSLIYLRFNSLLSIALISLLAGIFITKSTKICIWGAVLYIFYECISLMLLLRNSESLAEIMQVGLLYLIEVVITIPMVFGLTKLGQRIRKAKRKSF